jgi:hypothetical protein
LIRPQANFGVNQRSSISNRLSMRVRGLFRHLPVAFCVAAFAACRAVDAPHEAQLIGTVSYKFATVPGASYPGEIGIAGTAVGTVRVYIETSLPMSVRLRSGTVEHVGFATIVVGDSVAAWYNTESAVLDSDPPVYPVVRLEFRR